MKIIQDDTTYEVLAVSPITHCETAGRTCYQSATKKPTTASAAKFIRMLIKRGHESVLEHGSMTVAFDNCSRGLTHELVRHRLASFSQESTRYVDYTREGEVDLDRFELKVVCPPHLDPDAEIWVNDPDGTKESEAIHIGSFPTTFRQMAQDVEDYYRALRKSGWEPEDARQILPIGTRSRIVVTANYREWRHIFKLRTAPEAHWEIRTVMRKLLKECRMLVPAMFDDVGELDG